MALLNVVILGGGITGLTVAYHLRNQAKQRGISLEITLFESDHRLGGKIKTHRTADMTLELGPDSIFTPKLRGISLFQELGLDRCIVPVNPSSGTKVLWKGRLQPLPGGFISGIPSDMSAFAKTHLISVPGKLRALGDLLLPSHAIRGDISVGHFIRDRIGHEVVDVIAAPMLAGIHAADIYRLSLDATMPALRQMCEENHGLIRGVMAQRKNRAKPASTKSPMFISFQNGLESLTDALSQSLGEDVHIVRQASVTQVMKSAQGGYQISVLHKGTQHNVKADAVVVTTPTYEAAQVLSSLPICLDSLRNIRYASTATVLLGFHDKNGPSISDSGFLVPPREAAILTACTVVSNKWPHALRRSGIMFRGYVGRDGDERGLELDDAAMVDRVTGNLKAVLRGLGEPEFTVVTKWHRAMPQYDVGHLARVAEIEQELKKVPGVELAGAGYRGMGIPDCIRDGMRAAERVLDVLAIQANEAKIPATV